MSMQISFTIQGNHKDPAGNAIPYKRVISHMWRRDASDYMDWCEYVRARYFKEASTFPDRRVCIDDTVPPVGHTLKAYDSKRKPINLTKHKAQVALKVYWANGKHGDLDNILKGILDALFENDKCVNGLKASCEKAADGKGRVEVIINISKLDHDAKGKRAGNSQSDARRAIAREEARA